MKGEKATMLGAPAAEAEESKKKLDEQGAQVELK